MTSKSSFSLMFMLYHHYCPPVCWYWRWHGKRPRKPACWPTFGLPVLFLPSSLPLPFLPPFFLSPPSLLPGVFCALLLPPIFLFLNFCLGIVYKLVNNLIIFSFVDLIYQKYLFFLFFWCLSFNNNYIHEISLTTEFLPNLRTWVDSWWESIK